MESIEKKNIRLLYISLIRINLLEDTMFSYDGGYNATTQVPVLFLIESLAGRI
jgi:hypothetical protein